jgi:hypothetical protein
MKPLTIGTVGEPPAPLTLNLESLVANRLLIQANSGGGKSNAIRLLVEKTAAHIPFVIIDPEGEFRTLREMIDLVLVGEGGELAASPKNAGELALKLLGLGVSAVIDIFNLAPADRREFVRRYCENLIAAPRSIWRPFMLVIDEAQLFCPENGDSVATLPITHLMTLARKREICAVLATPRFASIDTDARAPINNFLIGRATLDVDYKRAGEVLGMPPAERRTLASLRSGQFHAYGPSFGHDGVRLGQLALAQTRPPKAGKASTTLPAPSAAIRAVVPELEKIATTQNPDEVDTIEKARERIKALRVELVKAQKPAAPAAPAVDTAAMERVAWTKAKDELARPIHEAKSELSGIVTILEQVSQRVERAWNALEKVEKAEPAQPARHPIPVRTHPAVPAGTVLAVQGGRVVGAVVAANGTSQAGGDLPGPFRRILESAAYWRTLGVERPTIQQLAAGARYAASGSFDTYLSRMGSQGLLVRESGAVSITPDGWKLAPMVTVPASLNEHLDRVRAILDGPQQRIIDALVRTGAAAVADLAAACDPPYAASGSFDTYLSRLRSKGLIERRKGVVHPTEVLFPQGLR